MKFDLLVEEILQHQKNNLIVIFPGRFQPFHIGHKRFFDMAKKQFPGADFYIATSDTPAKAASKEPDRYPFNFAEKKQIMQAAGIPEKEIVQVAQPYKPIEILKNYDQNVAKVIYIVGEKDMKEDPRFAFGITKKGTPTYFQPFKSLNEMEPFKEQGGHGYIYSPGTIKFNVGGKNITSATELRSFYKAANEEQRKEYITQILGKFDPKIYNIFNEKLR
jgi:cytidyltransferase-like protein